MSKALKDMLRPSPFLRWAGSKRQLIPILEQFWRPSYRRYVEPFAGSASLFFAVRPTRAVLGDINPELIAAYRQIKYQMSNVWAILRGMPNNRRAFLKMRSVSPFELDGPTRAARFIYLNRFCFNGLYRTNSKGVFNVPYGGAKSGNLPSEATLRACSRALQTAALVCRDFEATLRDVRSGDFVYMDPPYSVKATRVFNEYGPSPFSVNDLIRLRACMDRLASGKVRFVVSYADSEEAELLVKGFGHQVVSVRRNIAGFTSSRRQSNEVLVFNI